MYRFACVTDKGKYEEKCDDRALVVKHIYKECTAEGTLRSGLFLAGVFDGIGGLPLGDRAAEFVAAKVSGCFRKGLTVRDLRSELEAANTALCAESRSMGVHGMMTTCAGVYIDGDSCLVFNAGDSRVYHQRDGFLTRLSKDHSYVQDLVDMGELTREQARVHPKSNVVNKCFGQEEPLLPRIKEFKGLIQTGDIIMICSDGVSDVMSDETISELIDSCTDKLSDCCRLLVEKAEENGSRDNLTALLIRAEEDAPPEAE